MVLGQNAGLDRWLFGVTVPRPASGTGSFSAEDHWEALRESPAWNVN